jgi:hypothetical protein
VLLDPLSQLHQGRENVTAKMEIVNQLGADRFGLFAGAESTVPPLATLAVSVASDVNDHVPSHSRGHPISRQAVP